jgi:uncharacterized protein YutE (UPF0331/DUF86 family)
MERVERSLDDIRSSLEIAKRIVEMSYGDFLRDFRNRYTLRLALVEIVEASVNLGLYLLRELLGVVRVEGYTKIFDDLVEHGVLSPDVGEAMRRLTRLRNLIIHRYWEVDDSRIYREARESGLGMIERFMEEVEKYASN